MGTGGLSWRSFAIQNWSRSNRRSHRRTRWASGASCLQSKASTTLSLACAPTAPNSSARWPTTRTSTDSATCEALRASSSRWPRNSSEAFTAFRETGGALGAPSTRSPGSQPSCFLAYLRRGFVRRTYRCESGGDESMTPEIDYSTLDGNIVSLVRVLNRYPGRMTVGSCGGQEHPKPGQRGPGEFYVTFKLDKSDTGWLTLEFLAWAVNHQDGLCGTLVPDAPPPFA